MFDVLVGRKEPPIWSGIMTLMEVADGYYARAAEITSLIHMLENQKRVKRGSPLYNFRTGSLRTFMEAAKRAADLGSRRLTDASLRYETEKTGRESKGWKD